MSKGRSSPYALAKGLAEKLIHSLEKYCDKMEIAGSIRRLKQIVHDIEIVALVKEQAMDDLFGQPVEVTRTSLDDAIDLLWDNELLAWRYDKLKGGIKHKRLFHKHTGIQCDLYVVSDRRAWGSWLAVRTGPVGFSKFMMQKALKLDMFFEDGFLLHNHKAPYERRGSSRCAYGAKCPKIIPLPTEVMVFEALKIPYLSPEQREVKFGIG
ncbi:hypothetical protein LCGC14_1605900 [marine sediment metagenome]|uniref:DNA polymerase beta thumb domain-containing protein n=1 Tax=marine sediment metagenome TaxID=412755 RepID=A0A0F9IA36_9ZZZZ